MKSICCLVEPLNHKCIDFCNKDGRSIMRFDIHLRVSGLVKPKRCFLENGRQPT